jgi:hypothetical protein
MQHISKNKNIHASSWIRTHHSTDTIVGVVLEYPYLMGVGTGLTLFIIRRKELLEKY